ncbi:aromatic prenyltransferase [Aspergillus parasiticus]|uniref:Aromatic prenyltransferase n=1 Tax=Aspergillus parasiticus TaxID=5067 RepID=A0A5N6D8M6_ASPPA|nr:aromatic prenyltransferase [Aspergillus parasiticus]
MVAKDWALLASLMSSAGYTNESQCQCLMFFYTSIVPYLGSYPQNFPSGAKPVIRVAVEPITSISGTNEDPYNLSPIRDFLTRLEKLNPEGYDSRLFEHFYPKHTLNESECQTLQAKNEAIRELSQVSFGFDLKPGGISVKGYTFPALKCHAAGEDLCSVVIGSVQEYFGDANCYNTLGLIKDYIEMTDAKANFGFVYSNDCVTPEKSRHKLYGRTIDMSWSKVEEIWTLGGRIDSPEANRGLEYLQEFWKMLQIGDRPHPLNYETKAGLKVPATKIYFPLYGLNDLDNVRAIAQYLRHIGLDVQGNAYEQVVRDSLRNISPEFAGVLFAYTEKTGVDLSVYYHSSLEYP